MAILSPSVAKEVDSLQGSGRYAFSAGELRARGNWGDSAFGQALVRLKAAGRIAMPRKGFYVIVPLEYRAAGCPPASWFVDDLMAFLGQPYYASLLTAAAIHGAGHQQPMAFQALTDRVTRPAMAGKVRVEFHARGRWRERGVLRIQTQTGTMAVSTPETTALDLTAFMAACGGLDHVTQVIGELTERLLPEALREAAAVAGTPEIQRLGFLLDHLGEGELAAALGEALAERRPGVLPLEPGAAIKGAPVHRRWRVAAIREPEAGR